MPRAGRPTVQAMHKQSTVCWQLIDFSYSCIAQGSFGRLVVSNIMILCPVNEKPVPTGLTTDMIVLETLEFEMPMRCSACREVHRWKRSDAWVDGERRHAGQ